MKFLDTCFLIDLERESARQERGVAQLILIPTAIEAGATLVTDNSRHFQRIEGLRVESYR